jgi:hypothetical protein
MFRHRFDSSFIFIEFPLEFAKGRVIDLNGEDFLVGHILWTPRRGGCGTKARIAAWNRVDTYLLIRSGSGRRRRPIIQSFASPMPIEPVPRAPTVVPLGMIEGVADRSFPVLHLPGIEMRVSCEIVA